MPAEDESGSTAWSIAQGTCSFLSKHLNSKVTDNNNNEVLFKTKRLTELGKHITMAFLNVGKMPSVLSSDRESPPGPGRRGAGDDAGAPTDYMHARALRHKQYPTVSFPSPKPETRNAPSAMHLTMAKAGVYNSSPALTREISMPADYFKYLDYVRRRWWDRSARRPRQRIASGEQCVNPEMGRAAAAGAKAPEESLLIQRATKEQEADYSAGDSGAAIYYFKEREGFTHVHFLPEASDYRRPRGAQARRARSTGSTWRSQGNRLHGNHQQRQEQQRSPSGTTTATGQGRWGEPVSYGRSMAVDPLGEGGPGARGRERWGPVEEDAEEAWDGAVGELGIVDNRASCGPA
ncbi:hypothetical protein DL769_004812 [Monosporascus sp. CRB-8-3]|nr:hypothetical protein DL769_004812 [Monosporascus sp. CRB-8-3]